MCREIAKGLTDYWAKSTPGHVPVIPGANPLPQFLLHHWRTTSCFTSTLVNVLVHHGLLMIIMLIVFTAKFSIVISSPRAYLLRNHNNYNVIGPLAAKLLFDSAQ